MKKLIFLLFVITHVNPNSKAQQPSQLKSTLDAANIEILAAQNAPTIYLYHSFADSTITLKDYDYYMRKSRNQSTVGWVTLGAGLLCSGIGIIIASNDNSIYSSSESNTDGALIIIGAASGIASIPFMVLSTVNKHKAKVLLSAQKTGLGVPKNVSINITGITLQIPIGK